MVQVSTSRPTTRAAAPAAATTPKAAARRRDELGALLDPDFFAALADPNRARIVACIARCRRACTVGEIAGCCALDLSVVSRHLKALAAADILDAEKDGRSVRYRLRTGDIAARLRGLADQFEANAPCDGDTGCCGGPSGCC